MTATEVAQRLFESLQDIVSDLRLEEVSELQRCAGSQFDPAVIAAFTAVNAPELRAA